MRIENRITINATPVMVWAAMMGSAAARDFETAVKKAGAVPDAGGEGGNASDPATTKIGILDCVPLERLTTRFHQAGMLGISTYELEAEQDHTTLTHTLELPHPGLNAIFAWVSIPSLKYDLWQIKSRAEKGKV